MKPIQKLLLALLAFSLSLALPVTAKADGKSDKDSADAAKKKAPGDTNDKTAGSPEANAAFEAELQQFKERVLAQAEKLKQQRAALESERQRVKALEQRLGIGETEGGASPEVPGTPASPGIVAGGAASSATPATPAVRAAAQEKEKESPLSFRIGGADFTPGGFVDFENVFRSTNTGFVTATNFWAIPFSNTVQGHLTEYRSTGQYSRFNLKTHAVYGQNDITGYIEFDFNGNDATNVFVTSNSHTDRIRVYWLDLKRGDWEFVGGQSWGLLTPRRIGITPNPSDVFTTIGEDAQVHVGVNYTRAGTFWADYHFNEHSQWAFGVENPDQFAGQGEVVFPLQFNAQLGGQLDAANQTTVPNVGPDIVSKFAYDTDFGKRHFHWELGGVFTTTKVTVLGSATGSQFVKHSKLGGGGQSDLVVDLFKTSDGKLLRFIGNALWGSEVGRYLIGMGPDVVVVPVFPNGGTACSGAVQCDVTLSPVKSGNLLFGVEFNTGPKTQFGAYYGGAYFQRNAFPDVSSTAATKPIIGFGGINESGATTQNRSIQEATLDWTQTFWRNPQYGAVLLVTQGSYVTRSPWFVAAGAPKNAHLFMIYASLRYVLP